METVERWPEKWIEWLIARGRWLLFPFFGLLIATLIPLALYFLKELWCVVQLVAQGFGAAAPVCTQVGFDPSTAANPGVEVRVLGLIDTSLIACLLIIVAFCGYHSFVSRLGSNLKEEVIRQWMEKVEFSDLKLKLMSAIVAISGIELLKDFLSMGKEVDELHMKWKVGVHLTFAVSVLLFAISDRISNEKHRDSSADNDGLKRSSRELVETTSSRVTRSFQEIEQSGDSE